MCHPAHEFTGIKKRNSEDILTEGKLKTIVVHTFSIARLIFVLLHFAR